MNLSEVFIRRPIATSLLMAAIALFGVVAYRALPVSDLPQVEYPTINVFANLPGGDPNTMASAVASPLERQFTTIAGVDSMVSSSGTGNANITRGDNYVDYTVKKIQASDLWNNPQKKVAIVLMFDEGSATSGFNGAAGWNPGNSTVANPLKQNADGSWSVDNSINNYTKGNRGHGESVYGVLTNQANAPKGVADSDAYSHFSFVRTLQDMFLLADLAKGVMRRKIPQLEW